jgi:hypothetical protein
MTVLRLRGCRSAPLFLNKDFRLEKGAEVIGAFAGDTHFDRLPALIARRRIEIQAIAACMQVSAAVFAAIRNLDLLGNLNFRGAVVASRNQMKSCFDTSSRPLLARRRLRPFLAIIILIPGLTILSAHFPPKKSVRLGAVQL